MGACPTIYNIMPEGHPDEPHQGREKVHMWHLDAIGYSSNQQIHTLLRLELLPVLS